MFLPQKQPLPDVSAVARVVSHPERQTRCVPSGRRLLAFMKRNGRTLPCACLTEADQYHCSLPGLASPPPPAKLSEPPLHEKEGTHLAPRLLD